MSTPNKAKETRRNYFEIKSTDQLEEYAGRLVCIKLSIQSEPMFGILGDELESCEAGEEGYWLTKIDDPKLDAFIPELDVTIPPTLCLTNEIIEELKGLYVSWPTMDEIIEIIQGFADGKLELGTEDDPDENISDVLNSLIDGEPTDMQVVRELALRSKRVLEVVK